MAFENLDINVYKKCIDLKKYPEETCRELAEDYSRFYNLHRETLEKMNPNYRDIIVDIYIIPSYGPVIAKETVQLFEDAIRILGKDNAEYLMRIPLQQLGFARISYIAGRIDDAIKSMERARKAIITLDTLIKSYHPNEVIKIAEEIKSMDRIPYPDELEELIGSRQKRRFI